MDQAYTLRQLVKEQTANRRTYANAPRVITVTSGKGGVGKTNFSANLAICLSRRGLRVVILDADFGLANIEVLFGVLPSYSLAHILSGEKFIEEVLTDGPCGIKFVSAGSGFKELANIKEWQMAYLLENLSRLDELADVIIIDTGAGISESIVKFVMASDETVLVTTPEPTSITDAYALIKTVREESKLSGSMAEIKIVVNRIDEKNEGVDVFTRLYRVAERFLGLKLDYIGSMPYDPQLVKAVKKQQPVLLYAEGSPYSRAITVVAEKLMEIPADVFWDPPAEKPAGVPGENLRSDTPGKSREPEKTTERQGIRGFMKKFTGIFKG